MSARLRMDILALVCGLLASGLGLAQAQVGGSSLDMTANRLFEESLGHVKRMQKIYEAHKKLAEEATQTGLIVAMEAIAKDLSASRELLDLAKQLLAELERNLALSDPENANLKIKNIFDYPQVREIRILSDQAENLFRGGKRFLESMQKPTEFKVNRQEADSD